MLIRDTGMVGGLKPASKSNSNHQTNRIVLDQRDSRQKLMNLLALLTFLICFASQLLQPTTAFFMQGPNTPLNADHFDDKGAEGWSTVPSNSQKRRQYRNHKWSEPPITIEYIPQDSCTVVFQPFFLLLAGLPGSGKSTFARALERAMPYKFVRINQDELGNRKICERKAKEAMEKGLCVVLDRCNFDSQQRKVWYSLAAQFSYPVDCIILNVPIEQCIRRCQQRTGHETIPSEDASRVVNIVNAQWRTPNRSETQEVGVRHYRVIHNSDQFNDAILSCLNQQ